MVETLAARQHVLEIGAKLQALDSYDRWCAAENIDVHTTRGILIHYIGWPSKWDEWIESTSDRLRRESLIIESGGVSDSGSAAAEAPASSYGSSGWPERLRFEDVDVSESFICVILMHRRLVKGDGLFPNKHGPIVFGTPILVYVDPKTTT